LGVDWDSTMCRDRLLDGSPRDLVPETKRVTVMNEQPGREDIVDH